VSLRKLLLKNRDSHILLENNHLNSQIKKKEKFKIKLAAMTHFINKFLKISSILMELKKLY
jgi:hypothetical protein